VAQSGSDTAIEVREVVHTFGEGDDPRRVLALSNLSMDIRRGELVCFIGPSGCGKSTMLNMIGGLIVPTEGDVRIRGESVTGPRPREVAYMFQEGALTALHAVGLPEFADHYPSQLSGGMKQRVALARALSLQTDILLMDEPFGALDEQTRMVLGEDLSSLLSSTQKTIVFVTHSLGEAVFLADRVFVFTARPGCIKAVLEIDEPHPRKPSFITSGKYNELRTELYSLLHDEIRKSMDEREQVGSRAVGG
jgi:NitT/TauT family transport system ATP-binding protein